MKYTKTIIQLLSFPLWVIHLCYHPDGFREIFTEIHVVLITVLLSWLFIYKLLTLLKINEVNWKRLQQLCIFTALIGILTIVNNNNKDYNNFKKTNTEEDIKEGLSRILYLLDEPQACIVFVKTNYSPENLEECQIDQNKFCKWAKSEKKRIEKIKRQPTTIIDTNTIKQIKFKTSSTQISVNEYLHQCRYVNNKINALNEINTKLKSSLFDDIIDSVGFLILIFAFSLSLAISSHDVFVEKNKMNQQSN